MKWVVDASVVGKWLAPETDSSLADALLDDELHVPDLLYPEIANLLWKKQSRGEMSPETVAAAASSMRHAPLLVHESVDLLDDALSLAVDLDHPAYDCFYLALARRLGAPLVTADRRLWTRCQAGDAAALSPFIRRLVPA